MKILVIGGTGLIGSKVVARLREHGHDAVAAAPSTGVNTLTGEGLDAAMAGVHTVVDVANSPSFAADDVMHFFTTAGHNIAAAERKAGVAHHVALSIVGTDRKPGNAYFAAKDAQEGIIRDAGVPYSIVRATQFLEFTGGIANEAGQGPAISVSTGGIQPIAAEEVAAAVADAAMAPPINGFTEIAGPEALPMDELVRRYLRAKGDARQVKGDPGAPYFGGVISWGSLLPGPGAHLGKVGLDAWLAAQSAGAHGAA
ncbi:SDR family oxidoreductase [Luteibacter aegosomatissinici]|uniref:SDR family oxidoreductase n=1 Tax=Luteibacter aegosomatissinici TaxID=2911539 RepID=UPI001FFC173D|nr:SDR family oxidoreductase [Luteibacter aegosomatissinici]UPG92971.1 SDR family oxidoreductase [Luteibacter aegosomatissinici]